MATGYKPLGKVKTVVLPVPRRSMTIDEYKETYGIDLRNFLEVIDGDPSIHFKDSTAGTLFLISNPQAVIIPLLAVPNDVVTQDYEEGASAALINLNYHDGDGNVGYGISFSIDKDATMNINNLGVYPIEY